MAMRETDVDPLDVQVGDDGDAAGIAQTITVDDIQAIVAAPEPVENRREQLKMMKNDLEARMSADRGHEFDTLMEEVDRAIAQLDDPAADAGFVIDEADRSDALSPDDDYQA